MLNLSTLQTYLTQLLSPTDAIHTALLLTPEGAIRVGENTTDTVTHPSSNGYMTPPDARASSANEHTPPPWGTPPLRGRMECAASGSGSSCLQRSKDEIWILAGLSAEVWAETRGEEGVEKGMGMVESELGRIVVVPVDGASQDEREPLLLLAVNGGAEADWKTMCAKAKKLGAYLAPSVNKHRGAIEASPLNRTPAKSRTRSMTTSPGGVV
ncbi:hypothetical protein EV702DRAFT_1071621 [Suillus placidus]|uniref:Uncharacterized protein n=1 Tax=Suillus placidus TaxID=48579 RepID=A0A9P7A4E8_9AGAM|nr:hypothetical protein EV702DRAFT_1071621 [Suillus placidus]